MGAEATATASRDIDKDALLVALERAPVLAERLAREAPFHGVDATIARAHELLGEMSGSECIAVLDAHPRIGADAASLSALSREEQGADADVETLRDLARMNDEYEARFGFRFVVFVAGRSKAEIVTVLRARLRSSRDEELRTGIDEFLAITRARLTRS